MKRVILVLALLIAAPLIASADEPRNPNAVADEELITVDINDADLFEFVQSIRTVSGREIHIDPAIKEGKVSLHETDITWSDALRRAIEPLGLIVHTRDDNALVILKSPQ